MPPSARPIAPTESIFMQIPSYEHFASILEAKGDRTALRTGDGAEISYAELARRADAVGKDLRARTGRDRGLLLIEMANTPGAVAAYLGALRARWPVMLATEGKGDPGTDLVTRFGPDLIWRNGILMAGPGKEGDLHPDLGVMLSTSGSTGSTKLVRLSRANLHENARSIAEYLDLTPDRVAVTTLPMHYSYGLSVLNSFLLAGAQVALSDASVIDPGFRPFLDHAGVTDLAGVPYTYELFERMGLRDDPPATLRAMTQAGGRLSPDLVVRYGEFSRDRGLRFFVMYGQTEATARMAYLPPDLTLANADCIGVPIPRGCFELRAEDGAVISGPGQPGELIYRGPNVMMGYGLERADLAHGAELSELATGDIAELRANGLYRIVGRMSRFSKIAGLRIGFDEVEGLLREAGFEGHVTGDDRTVLLALRSGDPAAALQAVAAACSLPVGSIFAWVLKELPVLSSGKVDTVMLRDTGLALAAEARATEARAAAAAGGGASIARLYARALNRPQPPETASFSSLGGDSLAYVTVSIGVEEMLGTAPQGWESLPIRDIQLLADAHATAAVPGRRARPKLTIGMDVLLRLLAISLIFIGHGNPDHTEFLRGGSSILFALAGYSMAMIHLPQLLYGRVRPFIEGVFTRLVVPYLLLVTLMLMVTPAAKSICWYLLVSVFVLDPVERGPLFSFWFVESLIHAFLITCGLFLIPAFRAQMRARPYAVIMGLSVLAGGLAVVGRAWWPNGNEINLTVDGWLYAFFLGWAVFFAKGFWQKVSIPLLALVIALDQFGADTGRAWWLMAALIMLLSVPTLLVGYGLGKALVVMSGATYFMYLCHPMVVHVVKFKLEPMLGPMLSPVLVVALVYLGSILAGLTAAVVWRRLLLGFQHLRARRGYSLS